MCLPVVKALNGNAVHVSNVLFNCCWTQSNVVQTSSSLGILLGVSREKCSNVLTC